MGQHDMIPSNQTTSPADTTVTDLMVGDAGDVVCLHRLRSAVAEIFTAVQETLRDERSKAAECLRRAEAMLETVATEALPARIIARRGLAPWQRRRVLTYIDANLDTSIRNKELAAVVRLSEFHFNVAFRN